MGEWLAKSGPLVQLLINSAIGRKSRKTAAGRPADPPRKQKPIKQYDNTGYSDSEDYRDRPGRNASDQSHRDDCKKQYCREQD